MSEESQAPIASTRSELRNLRNNSQATVAELKAFLAEMKGRSPQEMLGMVAGNQLFRATVHSLILIGVILLVFTVIPYLTRGSDPESEPATATATPTEALPAEPEQVPDPAVMEEAAGPDALETLGVGEEIEAPPNVNPLDGETGSFLEELE